MQSSGGWHEDAVLRVIFRCDASPQIGLGHLMRCRTLAYTLRQAGVRCIMVGPKRDFRVTMDSETFDEWLTRPDWGTSRQDAENLEALAVKNFCDVAVLDDYRVDEQYQQILLKAGLRWLQFNGKADKPLWADWVVSMSPDSDVRRYRLMQRRSETRLLLGPRYAVLREEFLQWRAPRQIKSHACQLLLTFGGGDDRGACLACLDALRQVDIFDITILSGGCNPQVASIQAWMKQNATHRVCLLLDDTDVARRMAEADIAVTAGGTTTFEMAMLGLPMLIVQIADNQRANAEAWERMGVAVNLGPLGSLNAGHLRDQLIMLAGDRKLRERMSLHGREWVDGRGAKRLVQELYPMIKDLQ